MKKLEKGKKGTHGALSKVMPAEALVGMLLAMGTGASNAPKGGLDELLEAALKGDLQLPERNGKFGNGAYKDEPWSIVAMRKRIYAVRAFYEFHLEGEKVPREEQPGYDPTVCGTLNQLVCAAAGHEATARAKGASALPEHWRQWHTQWYVVTRIVRSKLYT